MREFAVVDYILKEREIEGIEFTPLQKELIFKEISFRLKNSLNTISSLFGLQILNAGENENEDISRVLHANKIRIDTISILNDSLCKSRHGRLSFTPYLYKIIDMINGDRTDTPNVSIYCNAKAKPQTIVRTGTVFCELYTNTLRHAFDKGQGCSEIFISFSEKGDELIFLYHEKEHKVADIRKILESETIGIKLIRINSLQLNAKFDFYHDRGLVFRLAIPLD